MTTLDELERTVQVLRAMAYEHRLHLLLLLRGGEQTPGALAEAVRLESTLVAHHLRYLREAHLISRRRHGRHVYYALTGDAAHRLIEEVLHFTHPTAGPTPHVGPENGRRNE